MPDVAAAPVGDAPCCAKSIDDKARPKVLVSDWCSGAGVAGGGPCAVLPAPVSDFVLKSLKKSYFETEEVSPKGSVGGGTSVLSVGSAAGR